jgi:hypothetical protein
MGGDEVVNYFHRRAIVEDEEEEEEEEEEQAAEEQAEVEEPEDADEAALLEAQGAQAVVAKGKGKAVGKAMRIRGGAAEIKWESEAAKQGMRPRWNVRTAPFPRARILMMRCGCRWLRNRSPSLFVQSCSARILDQSTT